jgi:predicted transcriptional regulator
MGREGSYTTVLKLLQIMADKGLVRRDEASRTHVYEAAASEADTQRQLVGDLLHRAFDGAAGKLVLRALEDGKVSPGELAEIRKLLNKRTPFDSAQGKGEDK